MDIKQLTTFVHVANYRSFSKAAEHLYLTQPTVSNHVHSLEADFGVSLFNRFGKEITLTEAGKVVYLKAKDILNLYETTKLELHDHSQRYFGSIDIIGSSVPRKYFLPKVIKTFLDKYPLVSFNISDQDSLKVIEKINLGEADFGFVGTIIPKNNLEFIPIMEDHLVLISPNHCKVPTENITKEFLLKQRFIFREIGSGTRDAMELYFKSIGLNSSHFNVAATVEDVSIIKRMVSIGIGYSFISSLEVENSKNSSYNYTRIPNYEHSRTFYLVIHKNRYLTPISEKFKAFIMDFVSAQNKSL